MKLSGRLKLISSGIVSVPFASSNAVHKSLITFGTTFRNIGESMGDIVGDIEGGF